ncbi:MAG TPA: SRPBCC family protein [Mycobacteriales bacterium]|nr:SRPBCC family protein [Mycobacteriales bacterium]
MSPRVTRSTLVPAPPDEVFGLVSDLPGMGRFSPEAVGGSWAGGRTEPAVGAVFRGRNAQGWRRWATRSTVTVCEPGRAFAFEVSSLGLPVAEWRYELAPEGDGTRLTESWVDRRGRLLTVAGGLLTGVQDREEYAALSIETTLERVRAAAASARA